MADFLNEFIPSPAKEDEERQKIQRIFSMVTVQNAIKLKDACQRNLLFVGRTRSGKSTAISVLKDPLYQCGDLELFSDTREPKMYPFAVEYNAVNYNINIIDTPGLFEQYANEDQVRKNTVIQHAIVKCLEHELTKIHAIFFVCSFVTGVNSQDIEAFAEFIKLFKGAEDKIVMLITRCEDLDKKQKQNLKQQVQQHPKIHNLVQLTKSKLFFIGSLSKSIVEKNNAGEVAAKTKNVLEMRTELYNYIFKEDSPSSLKHLEYFKQKQLEAEELQKQIALLNGELESKSLEATKAEQYKNKLVRLTEQYNKVAAYVNNQHGLSPSNPYVSNQSYGINN